MVALLLVRISACLSALGLRPLVFVANWRTRPTVGAIAVVVSVRVC
ncbi:hypothetical protein [Halpernia humi]|nr:hypothetical protein [Halpernia humi]